MDNLFKLEKENESTEEKLTADIKKLFEHKEEEYYKLVKIDNFWNNNCIKYKSYCNRIKNLSIKEYLDRIETYSKGITINFQKSDTW